ncbi:hypothetical protein M405DRAFT_929089 [Rhizopogon salebrosus TDB-379]|nr:hypothetical protein M405DRAFT_929089 [Rhizopogon salebrosus TDB-379]
MPTHVHVDPTAGAEFDNVLHQRQQPLDDAERELDHIVHWSRGAEDRREEEYQQTEDPSPAAVRDIRGEGDDEPHLNFKGRPEEISPKAAARFWIYAGWLLPFRFKEI